jgi:sulfide:quinone oxidoreductase
MKKIDEHYYVSEQITIDDLQKLKSDGIKSIIFNRPDGEAPDQPTHTELSDKASELGMNFLYLPIDKGIIRDEQVAEFTKAFAELPKPILGTCRSGMRSTSLWALAHSTSYELQDLIEKAKSAGYDISPLAKRILNGGQVPVDSPTVNHDVVIVGGGAAGIAVAASLIKRRPHIDVAIIDPSDIHYYQPGWTMVGGGIFEPQQTVKTMAHLIPEGVKWIKAAVAAFEPEHNAVILEGCRVIGYKNLIVCPGLKLNWSGIEGLEETLGHNGVTSNYRFDLAPYTWELVKGLKSGKALFTQPPMPIKCAGAPQKAMYLSADHWLKRGVLGNVDIKFFNAGAVLFGVQEYVPALMSYVEKYGSELNFNHKLVKIDGPNKTAWFEKTDEQGNIEIIEETFDMIHVAPPQQAPDFIRASQLVDEAGWVNVDPETLRHKSYENIYALGDVINAPNAKTAAAARKQAPIVAHNLLSYLDARDEPALYDGYGSCPLTVERGKVVLAEFGYGGKLLPSFPTWLLNNKKPSRLAWFMKEKLLPPIYWLGMLKGHEWLVKPKPVKERSPGENR